ncbi:784_t:CDS:2 [Paraglomus brasilianum]|uniref:784_t:CDS:1 n=1 Tax=Paraglomus brasilianum TaxID=144538 RepID=A0A9N8ZEQ4_9GLOM|nr:784_t:CDS:2 [Paraglomus brasilianum]
MCSWSAARYKRAHVLDDIPDSFIGSYVRKNRNATDNDIIKAYLKQPALLSESDFLKLCPPSLGYINRAKSTGTTNSTYACMPESVVTWDDFEDDVNNTIWDDTPMVLPSGISTITQEYATKRMFGKHSTKLCIIFQNNHFFIFHKLH